MNFTYKISARDMRTPVLFLGYLESTSLDIIRVDILIRLFEYRTVLNEIERKSPEITHTFTNCCCLVYSAPYIRLLQGEADRTEQNVGFCYTEYIVSDL